jgi:hypothetical protein
MTLPSFIAHPVAISRLVDDGGAQRLVDALAAGETLSTLAKHYGCTRGAITRFIASLSPAEQTAIEEANRDGTSALAEQTIAIADAAALEMRTLTKPMYVEGEYITDLVDAGAILKAETERIKTRQWFAERKNAEMWGGKVNTAVQVNIGSIYLDALRHRNTTQAEIAVVEAPESVEDLL